MPCLADSCGVVGDAFHILVAKSVGACAPNLLRFFFPSATLRPRARRGGLREGSHYIYAELEGRGEREEYRVVSSANSIKLGERMKTR